MKLKLILLALAASLGIFAQERSSMMDHATVQVTRAPAVSPVDNFLLPHPVHAVARHPKEGCENTAECGDIFFDEETHNLRPSAGTNWQADMMSDTSTPGVNAQCNWMALTNTAVTPLMADTTLSGEIVSNGLTRVQGTYVNGSGTVSAPAAPTVAIQGTTGAVTYWYAVLAVNQGILTTVSSGTQTTTANATLSATAYVHVSWTPVAGATSYYVVRNTSNSFSGTLTAVAGRDSTSQPDCSATTCAIDDIANTLGGTSVAVPGSNLTNYGHYTLVHTWTASSAQSAQAFGIFTASSSGTMCFEGTFTQVVLNTNDTFQLTETVQF